MISSTQLKVLSECNITQLDINTLANIKSINIDVTQPINQRADNFFKKIENPYCFIYGNTPIQIAFSKNGIPLSDKITNHFINQKNR